MNVKHVRMCVAVCFALVIAGCDAEKGRAPDPLQQQWRQVQNYFEVIRLIDSGHGMMALTTFKQLAKQDAIGDRIVLNNFASGNTNKVRATLNMLLDGWIISEACHSQHPPFTVLLDNPERLRFLATLGAYRKEHPSPPFDSEMDTTVAEILMEAQRRVSKSNLN